MTVKRLSPEDTEIQLLVEALRLRHGYDFSQYAPASLRRRILALPEQFGVDSICDLLPRLLHDDRFLPEILACLSVPVTEMFRDPPVFQMLRELVVPILQTWPQIRIWQAGAATGEEAYSLAILLHEENLYDRCQIYATDINDSALSKAEEGVFPLRLRNDYAANYRAAGGKAVFSDYVVERYGLFRIEDFLRRNIVFSHHNLVADGVFCEVHLVLCRNVLIYFNHTLQDRVLHLFASALCRNGILCLGPRESLRFSEARHVFTPLAPGACLFRQTGLPS